MARIRDDHTYTAGPLSHNALVRQRVAEWIQDVDASGACVIVNDACTTMDLSGGLVLVNTLLVLARALEDIKVLGAHIAHSLSNLFCCS